MRIKSGDPELRPERFHIHERVSNLIYSSARSNCFVMLDVPVSNREPVKIPKALDEARSRLE